MTTGSFSNSPLYIFFGCILSLYTIIPSKQANFWISVLEDKNLRSTRRQNALQGNEMYLLPLTPHCQSAQRDAILRRSALLPAGRPPGSTAARLLGNAEVVPQRRQGEQHRSRAFVFSSCSSDSRRNRLSVLLWTKEVCYFFCLIETSLA